MYLYLGFQNFVFNIFFIKIGKKYRLFIKVQASSNFRSSNVDIRDPRPKITQKKCF